MELSAHRCGPGEACGGGGGTGDGVAWYLAPGGTTALYQQVECGLSSCAGGGSSWFHTRYARVILHDHQPPAVYLESDGLGSGRWVRRRQGIAYYAEDNLGVRRTDISVDGTCPESRRLRLRLAQAGCVFEPSRDSLRRDRSASPTVHTKSASPPSTPAGSRHRPLSPRISTTTPRPESPPRSRAVRVGDGRTGSTSRGRTRPRSTHLSCERVTSSAGQGRRSARPGRGTELESGASTTWPFRASGDYTLEVWRIDEAGNGSADDAKPSAPRASALRPRCAATGVRATGSNRSAQGCGRRQRRSIRCRERVDRDQAQGRQGVARDGRTSRAGHLIGYVDDQRFANGWYDLRAHATDYAGNTGSTDRQANGATAGVQLPVRVPTMLRVGARKSKVVRKRSSARWSSAVRAAAQLQNRSHGPRRVRPEHHAARTTREPRRSADRRGIDRGLRQVGLRGKRVRGARACPYRRRRDLHLQGARHGKPCAPLSLPRRPTDPCRDTRCVPEGARRPPRSL